MKVAKHVIYIDPDQLAKQGWFTLDITQPQDTYPLNFTVQNDESLVLYTITDDDVVDSQVVRYLLAWTDWPLPDIEMDYVGTATFDRLVYHLFEVAEE